jgi:cyclopropane fatty-acyl-phospholipid synthase-like methyltransferase
VLARELPLSATFIEYGWGASTLFAAMRTENVVSVETDPHYTRHVQAAADAAGADVKVVHVDMGPVGEWGIHCSGA